ncbi:hypothetical protein OROMI_031758 [Orobanche minor]
MDQHQEKHRQPIKLSASLKKLTSLKLDDGKKNLMKSSIFHKLLLVENSKESSSTPISGLCKFYDEENQKFFFNCHFLGTLVKQHVSLTHVNWHVVPQDLKKKMLKYTLDRVHKSRVKKDHYTKYDSDEKRIENRPHDIPLEDFKNLLKYWADEGVQSLAEDNAARRNSYADPHTLGRKTLAEVKEKLPNLASPSRARVYFKSRKHKEGRKYKTNRDAIKKRI